MKKFNFIFAQNAMGKSTLCKGNPEWLGNPIGPKPNTINVVSTKFGYLHDARNWIAAGHIDMKAFWEHFFIFINRHDLIVLNNSVDRLPKLPDNIHAAFVIYQEPRDGLERWMARDPSYFRHISADEGLHHVMRVRDAFIKALNKQPTHQVQLFNLQRGQYLSDLSRELFGE